VVGGQLQVFVCPCKLVHLQNQDKTHSATVISSCVVGQEKTCRFNPKVGYLTLKLLKFDLTNTRSTSQSTNTKTNSVPFND